MKEKNIKSSSKLARKPAEQDDLARNYDFDYAKAKPNRFAHESKDQMVVLLDKELTRVFKSPAEVTNALRSLIQAIPSESRKRRKVA
ncbi:MAG: hypothetical protein ABI444_12650 [Candidatus Kapaibacterium sp.]|jgi:hypothetical protein